MSPKFTDTQDMACRDPKHAHHIFQLMDGSSTAAASGGGHGGGGSGGGTNIGGDDLV